MNSEESLAKFMDNVEVVDGCWEWIHHRMDHGTTRNTYLFNETGQPRRFAWMMWCGEPDDSRHVMPMCGNDYCVNPFHLIHARRGLELWKAMGKCSNGHDVTADSVTTSSSGNAVCRRCRLEGLWRYKYRLAGVPEDRVGELVAEKGRKHWMT